MKPTFTFLCVLFCGASLIAGGIKRKLPVREPAPRLMLHMLAADQGLGPHIPDGKAISFGYYEFNSKLNAYLDSTTSSHDNFKPYNLGIGLDNLRNNGKHLDVVGSLNYILPQKVYAGNDSLQLRLSGWHYTMSVLGWDLVAGETVTLAIAPAWSWGNLKMRRIEQGQKTKYTNPFVAPGGRVEVRLTLGDFIIGGRATYRYDITHDLWKRKDNLMPVMPGYKNHGLAYFGYIGWIF